MLATITLSWALWPSLLRADTSVEGPKPAPDATAPKGELRFDLAVRPQSDHPYYTLVTATGVSWVLETGRVVWHHELDERWRSTRALSRGAATDGTAVQTLVAEAYHALVRPDGIVLANGRGLFVLDRKTGAQIFEWRDESKKRGQFFDSGTVRVDTGAAECGGEVKGPWFLVECNGSIYLYDGAMVAAIDRHPWTLVEVAPLQGLVRGGKVKDVQARVTVGKTFIMVSGIILD